MPKPYPEHPATYRREIVDPLFKRLRAGESCAIVGAASVAKSNLVRFLLRRDVQQHYLGPDASRLWMVLVDTHRLAAPSEWAFYELLLHSLVLAGQRSVDDARRLQLLSDLHDKVAVSEQRLLAQRSVERAVSLLCDEMGLFLVFLIDEADQFYRTADQGLFANLRALRDDHKYRLCYVLLTREPLDRLHPSHEREPFYELFSHTTLGLGPYRPEDALRVVDQLEARKGLDLTDDQRRLLVTVSGGHPGLLVAAVGALESAETREAPHSAEGFLAAPGVRDECQALWDSLRAGEQRALVCLAAGFSEESGRDQELLALKGLVVQDTEHHWRLFSPLFALFVGQTEEKAMSDFRVDDNTASVWVAGKQITGLSPLEFRLVRLLYGRRGQVLTRDDILAALHPEETTDAVPRYDSSVDSLVRQLRKKVEPVPSQPRYILTVRGHGYSLAGPVASEPA